MTDIISDLLRIRKELLQAKPIIQSIWFIDRPIQYACLMGYRGRPGHEAWPFGIPIYNYTSEEILDGLARLIVEEGKSLREARAAITFQHPGTWIQMSDGNHQHLEIMMEM